MKLNRNTFLEAFAVVTPSLRLIVLNHLDNPERLLADVSTIEILADKKAVQHFIAFCKIHPLVKDLIVSPQFRRKNITVEFKDGSELKFSLLQNVVFKTFLCLDVKSLRKTASVNNFGMLVPDKTHHFEFMIQKCQFQKTTVGDRYKTYFAGFEFNERAAIFKHIQTRYNLIFNTLEDLYQPKPNTILDILIGLRAEKENTLIRMFLRSMEQTIFKLSRFLAKKQYRILPGPSHAPEFPTSAKRSAGHVL